MKRYVSILSVVVCTLVIVFTITHNIPNAVGQENNGFSDANIIKPNTKPDEVTLTGIPYVVFNDKAKRIGRLVVDVGEEEPDVYNIRLINEGEKCVREMRNKKVEIVGTVAKKNEQKWLTVEKYREIKKTAPKNDVDPNQKNITDSAKIITVTGLAKCVRYGNGEIKSGQLLAEQDGEIVPRRIYNIVPNSSGVSLLKLLEDKYAEAKAELILMNGNNWLIIKDYKEFKFKASEKKKTENSKIDLL
ncbi:hypothetical protein ACFLS1_12145 [Verrucomicrobiota bacterium]